MSPPLTERDFAVEVVRGLRAAGHEALWAGGCVRDELLGLAPKDYDVATSARPEDMLKLLARVQEKTHPDSVVVLQAEKAEVLDELPQREAWEERRYGRNLLLIWVKELEAQTPPTARTEEAQERPND